MDGSVGAVKDEHIAEAYGAYYFVKGEQAVNSARPDDLYSYDAYVGNHEVVLRRGESLITLSADRAHALWFAGSDAKPAFRTSGFGVKLPGYQCGQKMVSLGERVNLPYVNGCATRQLFPPERVGDPTLQQLTIPPHTSEQVHHIHPTARVVFVLKGKGFSIVGQGGKSEETPLTEGMVCILDPMCPHHFRTEDDYLTVLPVHVWSSPPGGLDNNHPMFNGTKEV